MSPTIADRNERLRRRRALGRPIHSLAREFHITRMQVRRILDSTGGDPLALEPGQGDLADRSVPDLQRERQALRDRMASDRRRLRAVEDELDIRHTDRILGIG